MLTRNRFLLILIGALLAAFVLLASGLDSLTLSPAQPFDFSRNNEGQGLSANQIMPVIVFALALYVLIVALLLPRRVWQHWPTIAGILGVIALFVVAIMWGSTLLPPLEIETAETVPVEEPEETAVDETLPPPAPTVELLPVPERPLWATWLASGVLALLLAGLVFGIGRYVWPALAPPEETTLRELGREVQAALDGLEAGEDLHDVIIRCYVEMGRVLAESRAIERPQGMTPHEFEEQLLALGLPSAPVSQLTRLFEATRYGRQTADPAQQQAAVAALQTIAEAI